MDTVLITGNTFPVKDALKALGGRWDAAAKGWRVPSSVADRARQLVSGKTSARGAYSASNAVRNDRSFGRSVRRTASCCGSSSCPRVYSPGALCIDD